MRSLKFQYRCLGVETRHILKTVHLDGKTAVATVKSSDMSSSECGESRLPTDGVVWYVQWKLSTS